MGSNLAILMQRLKRIDQEAYDYVYSQVHLIDDGASEIVECFVWQDTPQGHQYWVDIARKLGENV